MDQVRNLEDAIMLLRLVKSELASGPDAPWRFVRAAIGHLEAQRNEVFNREVWEPLVTA